MHVTVWPGGPGHVLGSADGEPVLASRGERQLLIDSYAYRGSCLCCYWEEPWLVEWVEWILLQARRSGGFVSGGFKSDSVCFLCHQTLETPDIIGDKMLLP